MPMMKRTKQVLRFLLGCVLLIAGVALSFEFLLKFLQLIFGLALIGVGLYLMIHKKAYGIIYSKIYR